MMDSRLDSEIMKELICPVCKVGGIKLVDSQLLCDQNRCASRFPMVDGCPILINEENSVFAFEDYELQRVTTMDLRDVSEKPFIMVVKQKLSRLVPPISRSVNDYPVSSAMEEIRSQLDRPPKVLVIGSGDAELELPDGSNPVYSDVAIGRLTHVVFDAHDIPFPDGYFDAVVAVAVLEHVVDPYRCSDEIHRVLKSNGFVYAITPFMQQVHMGRYDFTRFTHLGHRRLFRRFSEERSGVANAEGMVLTWSIVRFFAGFSENKGIHNKLRSLVRFIAFPFSLFDPYLSKKAAAYDSASAYYFFGKKSDSVLSDRELIRGYRGMS